jgi:hypothetical protein
MTRLSSPAEGPSSSRNTEGHMMLNLHTLLPRSHANGPGVRMVSWFQDCILGCPVSHRDHETALYGVTTT